MINHNNEEQFQELIKEFAIKVRNSNEYISYKHCTFEEMGLLLAIKFAYIFKTFKKKLKETSTEYNYNLHDFMLMEEGFAIQLPRIGIKAYEYTVGSVLDTYLLAKEREIGTIISYLNKTFGITDEKYFLEGILLADFEIDYNDEMFEEVDWINHLENKPYIRGIIKNLPEVSKDIDYSKLS